MNKFERSCCDRDWVEVYRDTVTRKDTSTCKSELRNFKRKLKKLGLLENAREIQINLIF